MIKFVGKAPTTFSFEDVTGEINMMYGDQTSMKFQASNSATHAVGVIAWNLAKPPCAIVSAEPEAKIFDSGEVRFTLRRLNDSKEFKEFTRTVAESQAINYQCAR